MQLDNLQILKHLANYYEELNSSQVQDDDAQGRDYFNKHTILPTVNQGAMLEAFNIGGASRGTLSVT